MSEDMIYSRDDAGATAGLRSKAKVSLTRAAEQAKGALQTARGRTDEACSRVMDKARGQVEQVEDMVREKPLAAIGVVAAVGFLAGLALGGGLGAAGHREYLRRR